MRALMAGVERAGFGRERFLAEAGLTAAELADVTARVSIADYRRAVVAAITVTGDPAFGLHMGEHASTATFDVLGHLAEHSRCLREALEVSACYSRIVTVGPTLELCESGEACTIHLTGLRGDAPEVRLVSEFSTAALLQLIRRFVGAEAQVRHAFFAYEAPAHRSEYSRVFGGRERFSHELVGLEVERAWLDVEHSSRSPELLARVEQASSAAERVRLWLGSAALRARPTMAEIARDLGMSARSLRRRLRSEGVAFDDLLDGWLATHAKNMLADTRRSVKETAFAMGFATPAAFARAFKRWTGAPPSAHRAAHSSAWPRAGKPWPPAEVA